MKFYLLDIQPLCHLKDVEKDKYLPCEMAVLEYSLANGIHTSVHHFIDPGKFINLHVINLIIGFVSLIICIEALNQ